MPIGLFVFFGMKRPVFLLRTTIFFSHISVLPYRRDPFGQRLPFRGMSSLPRVECVTLNLPYAGVATTGAIKVTLELIVLIVDKDHSS